MSTEYNIRNTFPDIETKKLKQLYNASRSIKALCAIWILGLVFQIVILLYASFAQGLTPEKRIHAFMFFVPIIVLNLATIIGCFQWASWGRILGAITCILILFGFPLGTILGILGLIAFIRSPELFGRNRLDPDQLIVEYKMRKGKAQQGAAANP
jgi:hypothetical protein